MRRDIQASSDITGTLAHKKRLKYLFWSGFLKFTSNLFASWLKCFARSYHRPYQSTNYLRRYTRNVLALSLPLELQCLSLPEDLPLQPFWNYHTHPHDLEGTELFYDSTYVPLCMGGGIVLECSSSFFFLIYSCSLLVHQLLFIIKDIANISCFESSVNSQYGWADFPVLSHSIRCKPFVTFY